MLLCVGLAGCLAREQADRCELPSVSIEALSSISCASHTDTGYRNGTPFAITVVTVDGHPVERATANAYYVMAEAASRDGVEIRIVSGFRTMAEQAYLYRCYTSCSCNSCNLAARPGYSNHQSGHALDFNTSSGGVYAWLGSHGAAYGFARTVPSEAWHWEWWGGGPGGGPCSAAPPPPPPPPPPPTDADHDGVPAPRDCDDHDARRFPGNPEVCDGVDNDCDGIVDDHLVRACGSSVGTCVAGTETCHAGAWGACVGSVGPVAERCDQRDDDCDGHVDEDRVCEREEVLLGNAIEGGATESDVDGDGRADACAIVRGVFTCWLGSAHGFERAIVGPAIDASDVATAARVRMADMDGDGRADVCFPSGAQLRCFGMGRAAMDRVMVGPAISPTLTSLDLVDVDGDARLDVCVRDASGLTCHLASAHGFDRTVTLAALSDTGGFADPTHHGTLRFGDVDGDGRADACARDASGVACWRSLGDRFDVAIAGPRWSDASGWSVLARWSTIRLVDVDGDARADLCGRAADRFTCVRSTGSAFAGTFAGPPMPDRDGWSRPEVYTTIRLADVSGDRRADLCARAPAGVRCWIFDHGAFDHVVIGPALDDASGWTRAPSYRSIRVADVDGDGRADLCARASDGLRCLVSSNASFDRVVVVLALADAVGLDPNVVTASLRLAGGRAIANPVSPSLGGGCSVTHARSTSSSAALAALFLTTIALRGTRRRRVSPIRAGSPTRSLR